MALPLSMKHVPEQRDRSKWTAQSGDQPTSSASRYPIRLMHQITVQSTPVHRASRTCINLIAAIQDSYSFIQAVTLLVPKRAAKRSPVEPIGK